MEQTEGPRKKNRLGEIETNTDAAGCSSMNRHSLACSQARIAVSHSLTGSDCRAFMQRQTPTCMAPYFLVTFGSLYLLHCPRLRAQSY
jgi:hypothetical protein